MAGEPVEVLDTVACARAENAEQGFAGSKGPEGSRRGLLNLLNLWTLGPRAENRLQGGTFCPTAARPVQGRQRMGTFGVCRRALADGRGSPGEL
jgi:hypothetical protein